MSVRPSLRLRRPARPVVTAGVAVLACVALAACDATSAAPGESGSNPGSSASDDSAEEAPAAPRLNTNVGRDATDVPVSTLVKINTDAGELTRVKVTSPDGKVPGTMADDAVSWTADERLEPGTTYRVRGWADHDGTPGEVSTTFTTADLTLDEQTYASVAPLDGETVGVGMPVVVNFDVPVTDKAEFERNMTVTSSPQQPGSWHWMSDYQAHWRPKTYWKAGTKVDVKVDVNGVDAGNGIYGQEDRDLSFDVGDAHVYKIDAAAHQMKVFSNGALVRTIPVTTGKPGFTTRSGTKVIMEKFESKRMNSETVGIAAGSADSYDIDDVQYAMRLTNSGEFIHAAPWSVGSQGYANVSHGCTGISTDNAAFLFGMTLRGDVVETTGTDRAMEFDNGYGDWNESFQDYKQGSAL